MSDYTGASAIVVGGSIGGLTAALLLRDLGFTVDVYERTATALDGRGSGIVLQPDTVRWFTERSTQDLADLSTSTSYVQYLDRTGDIVYREKCTWTYTSWGTFYRALLADFNSSDTERYHYGEYACGFDQFDDHATVRFVSGRAESADLVVFADGVTSVARERFDPDAGLRYSGYIGWRGTFPVRDLDEATREVLQDAITYDLVPNSHITMYPIPGENGLDLDDRLMNYVWYRNVPAGPDLTEMCIDKRGFPGSVSVHPGQVQDRYVDEHEAGRGRTAGARGRRRGDRHRKALRASGFRCPLRADGHGPGGADRRRRLRCAAARRRRDGQGGRRRLGAGRRARGSGRRHPGCPDQVGAGAAAAQ